MSPMGPDPHRHRLGWNVGNSFSRHAPRRHLPGGTHHLAHCICHLEETNQGGIGGGEGRGPPRRIVSLSAHISPFKNASIPSRFGRKPSYCHQPPPCQTFIGWILCLVTFEMVIIGIGIEEMSSRYCLHISKLPSKNSAHPLLVQLLKS